MIRLSALLLSLCLVAAACSTRADTTTFAVLGDMPYDSTTQFKSLKYIGQDLREEGVPVVIHYGDIKGGEERCDPALLRARSEIILGLLPGRVVVTPGDNDWTDCDREKAGGFDELDQLEKLRALLYSGPPPGGEDWTSERQGPDFPENLRWRLGDLQFVTLHVVGTENGRHKIFPAKTAVKGKSEAEITVMTRQLEVAARQAANRRDQANLEWLKKAFQAAEDARGLVVVMHTDPTEPADWDRSRGACGGKVLANCDPYATLMDSLRDQAASFDKPVLLVHGSTGSYCLFKDFGAPDAPKLWRLNGPGDFVVIDASLVTFDPDSENPFTVKGVSTGDPVALCPPPRKEQ